jgi:glycosyltransferase involved in cell wall biosynthesis
VTEIAADVHVHVASLNTAAATELCVRTIHRFAGRPFELVVGDGGSTDGTLPRLRDMEQRGWLRLEVAPEGRRHAEWLNHWFATCPARYAVFVDSDMQFRRDGWLRELVDAAQAHDAAMVTSRIQTLADHTYVDDKGRLVGWAPRPTPWLILVDVARLRGAIDEGFGFRVRKDPDDPTRATAYDTGAAFFEALQAAGFRWATMPDGWAARTYHHFGGMTWIRNRPLHLRRRALQAAKRRRIAVALWRARRGASTPQAR